MAPNLQAQMTATQLLGPAVDNVDDRYRDVSDAIVLFQRGNGPAALSMLREARKKQTQLPPGEVMFAHLCFASGNNKPGLDALQAAAVSNSNDPEVWNMLADLQLRNDHLAEAELLFRQAANVAMEYTGNEKRRIQQLSSAYAGAALANERRGLWKEAEVPLRAWQEIAPENAEIASRLAIVLINTERFDEATAMLEQLRAINPQLPSAEIVLGNAYERLGRDAEAEKSMQAALQKHPEDFDTQISVARWAIGTGHLDQALDCAKKADSIQPDSYLPELIIAQVDYLRGEFQKAEGEFQKVFQAKPGNYDAMNGLALSLLAQNDPQKNRLALEHAEVISKTNNHLQTAQGRQAATLLAWALHRNGRNEDAQKLMDGILGSGPVSSEGAYFAAAIYSEQGRNDLAQQAIEKALSTRSAFPYQQAATQLQQALRETKGTTK